MGGVADFTLSQGRRWFKGEVEKLAASEFYGKSALVSAEPIIHASQDNTNAFPFSRLIIYALLSARR